MMRCFCLLLFTFIFYLSGCGVSSLYGPAYYDETSIGDGLQRVTFKGGHHPVTGDLCLLRCAELTIGSGFNYFQVVDSESGSSIRNGSGAYPFHRHYFINEPFIDDLPFVTKTIRMFDGKPNDEFAYDASEVEKSLRRKYDIK